MSVAPDRTRHKPKGSDASNNDASTLVSSAAALDVHQAERLVDESEMRIRAPALGRGVGGLVFTTAAVDQSRNRVRDRREAAVARATQAIAGNKASGELGALQEAGRRAVDEAASRWLRSAADIQEAADTQADSWFDYMRRESQVMFDWAALASVGVNVISDDDYAILYGPWWRAVIRGVRPIWVARWSLISLVGCWLTIAGVVLAPFVNKGDAAYATLAIIVAGCAVWGLGALLSSERSRPRPEPVRTLEPRTGTSMRITLRWVWRLPEAVVFRVVRFSQLR